MGAERFEVKAKGRTAQSAFNRATKEARYEHGHGGYSGTIAEKTEFTVIEVPKGRDPKDYADSDEALALVEDKWGPAGCIKLGKDEWLFFGWASS